jgi:response regulator of citrate/malate metabolism
MARTAAVSDEKIVKTLARRKRGFTAVELSEKLGTTITTSRLNGIAGVEVLGTKPTNGQRGRPARIYGATGPDEAKAVEELQNEGGSTDDDE